MSKKCTVDNLGDVIAKELQLYCADTQIMVAGAVDKRADELVKALKADSPKKSGDYAKDWTSKVETNNFSYYKRRIHNKKHYRLTHLLEKGHALRQGGRTKAVPHIGPDSERIQAEFVKDVEYAIRNGGGLRSRHIGEGD